MYKEILRITFVYLRIVSYILILFKIIISEHLRITFVYLRIFTYINLQFYKYSYIFVSKLHAKRRKKWMSSK